MFMPVILVLLLVQNEPETAENPGFHFSSFALIRSDVFWSREKRG